MNKYFINITKNLNLKAPIINTTDDIQSLTKNYENHISIRKIKEAYPEIVPDSFRFISAQPEITCSKLTIETLEQGVKYVQS